MAEKTAVEELSDFQFLKKLLAFFGVRRATEIFGYAVVMGATGKVLPSEIVHALVRVGFTRSAVYRALADISRFVVEIERERGRTMSMSEVLAEINAAGVSQKEDIVL